MKCQILFSGEGKKDIIDLSSAESAHSVSNVIMGIYIRCFMHWYGSKQFQSEGKNTLSNKSFLKVFGRETRKL